MLAAARLPHAAARSPPCVVLLLLLLPSQTPVKPCPCPPQPCQEPSCFLRAAAPSCVMSFSAFSTSMTSLFSKYFTICGHG